MKKSILTLAAIATLCGANSNLTAPAAQSAQNQTQNQTPAAQNPAPQPAFFYDDELRILPPAKGLGAGDFESLRALFDLHFGAQSVPSLIVLFEKSRKEIYLKEALRKAFLQERDHLPRAAALAREHLWGDADALRILCAYYEQTAQAGLGREAARALIALQPQVAVNYAIYAVFLPPREASLQLRKAYALAPSADSLVRLCENLKQTGEFSEAIFVLEAALGDERLNKNGANSSLELYLANFYVLKHEFVKAERLFLRVFERDGNAAVVDFAAQMWVNAKNPHRARALLEAHAVRSETLMMLYAQLGEQRLAIALAHELAAHGRTAQESARLRAQEAIYTFEFITAHGDGELVVGEVLGAAFGAKPGAGAESGGAFGGANLNNVRQNGAKMGAEGAANSNLTANGGETSGENAPNSNLTANGGEMGAEGAANSNLTKFGAENGGKSDEKSTQNRAKTRANPAPTPARAPLVLATGGEKITLNLRRVLELFDANVIAANSAVAYNYFGYLLIDFDLDVRAGLALCLKAHELDRAAPFIADSVAWGYFKLGDIAAARQWFAPLLQNRDFMQTPEAQAHRRAIFGAGWRENAGARKPKFEFGVELGDVLPTKSGQNAGQNADKNGQNAGQNGQNPAQNLRQNPPNPTPNQPENPRQNPRENQPKNMDKSAPKSQNPAPQSQNLQNSNQNSRQNSPKFAPNSNLTNPATPQSQNSRQTPHKNAATTTPNSNLAHFAAQTANDFAQNPAQILAQTAPQTAQPATQILAAQNPAQPPHQRRD